MKRTEFEDLLDRYGADLASWPQKDQAAARQLIAIDSGAGQALAQARHLEDLLRGSFERLDFEDAANAAVERVLLRLNPLPAQERPEMVSRVGLPGLAGLAAVPERLPRIAALAFAAALGIVIGYVGAERQALEQRRLSVAMDDMESGLSPGLFDVDPLTGAPR